MMNHDDDWLVLSVIFQANISNICWFCTIGSEKEAFGQDFGHHDDPFHNIVDILWPENQMKKNQIWP